RHEGVELIAVLGALELFDELGEAAGLFLEAATLLLEPLELAAAILVEGKVAGGREVRARPEALREAAEGLLEERLGLVAHRVSHELPDQIGERQWPEEEEGEDDPEDLQPPAPGPAVVGAIVPARGGRMAVHRNISACE